jgi:hypothetical protein
MKTVAAKPHHQEQVHRLGASIVIVRQQLATSHRPASRPGVGRSRNLQLGPPIPLAKGAEVAAPGYLQDPRGGRGMPVVCV